MIHKEISESGLSKMFGMSNVVDSEDPRSKFIGRVVRYLENADTNRLGKIILDYDFIIEEIQNDYAGNPMLRGYAVERTTGNKVDTFGRVIDQNDVKIIS